MYKTDFLKQKILLHKFQWRTSECETGFNFHIKTNYYPNSLNYNFNCNLIANNQNV